MLRLIARRAVVLCVLAAGCGAVDPAEEIATWNAAVAARTGQRPSDDATAFAVPPTGLSEADAVRAALARHPIVAAQLARLGVAKADQMQAGLLPNPTVSGNILFSSGPLLFNVDLLVELTALAQRPRKVELAQAGVDRTIHDGVEVVLAELIELRRTWRELVFAELTVELLGEAEAIYRKSHTVAEQRQQGGTATEIDVNLAATRRREAHVDRLEAEGNRDRLRTELAHRLSLPEARPGRLTPMGPPSLGAPPPEYAAAVESALAHRSLLLSADAKVREAESQQRLAGLAGGLPIPLLGGSIQENPPTAYGPAAEWEIPIFDQGLPRIARAGYVVDEARAERRALELRVRREIAAALSRSQSARARLAEIREELLPLAERNLTLTRAGYDAGLTGLTSVLLAQASFLDARRRLLESQRQVSLAELDIDSAVGRWISK